MFEKKMFDINGGNKVTRKTPRYKWPVVILLVLMGSLFSASSVFAQGSIYGSVANSDASTPANGQIIGIIWISNIII